MPASSRMEIVAGSISGSQEYSSVGSRTYNSSRPCRIWPGHISKACWITFTTTLLLFCFSSLSMATPDQGTALIGIAKSWGVLSSLATWVPGEDPCVSQWEGVLCDGQGHVNYLNLTNKGLKGPIPAAMSSLTSLVNLDLSNALFLNGSWNIVTGDLNALSNLTNLQHLNMSYNALGPSPNAFPSAVLGLTNLITLRMDHCGIIGQFPPLISNLKNLQFLYLGNNSMTGPMPKELGLLVNLLELSLWKNNFDSELPPDLQYIKQLNYLNLHLCGLWGGLPPEFGNFYYMQRLILYRNSFTGPIPDRWKGMTNLTYVRLDQNYLYSPLKPWILQLPNINSLFLGSNLLYGTFPNVTTQAQVLSLDCNYLTGPLPTLTNISTNDNCFQQNGSANLVCTRAYTCATFQQKTSNGGCPTCPNSQWLVNPSVCICSEGQASSNTNKTTTIGAVVGSVAAALVLFLICLFLLIRRNKRHKPTQDETSPFDPEKPSDSSVYWDAPTGVQRYTYQDLEKATRGFSKENEIGAGGYGKVFCGTFNDGKTLAIKRASATGSQGLTEFRNEVLLLSRLHHKNLVRLEGFCEEKQILVYEFMKLGNLHSHLFRKESTRRLDWFKRLDIAVGIARALEYLHTHADPPVIHRDVKPSNVLLDDFLTAKVADFGISKTSSLLQTHVSTDPAGTAGYFDPQYFIRHQLTTASDVYSFGVVLLELVTGKKAIDHTRDEANLMAWAKPKLSQDRIESIVDPLLGDNYPRDIYFDMADLALKCTTFEKEDRPTMRDVLAVLEPPLLTHKGPTPAPTPARTSGSWATTSSAASTETQWPTEWSTHSNSTGSYVVPLTATFDNMSPR